MNPELVIAVIEDAFKDLDRPDASLRQFKLTDDKGMSCEITQEEWVAAGKNRIDHRWSDIPDEEIEECGCQLAHMQDIEFVYFLPAYMRFAINHYKLPIWKSDILGRTVFALNPSSKNQDTFKYNLRQYSCLNQAQAKAIICYLDFVIHFADGVERPDAKRAKDKFWTQRILIT